MIKATVTELHLKEERATTLHPFKELELAIDSIFKQCRKRDVDWLKAKLCFSNVLFMPIEVHDRGKRMQVDITADKRKTYAFDANGVTLALGDLIREKYQGQEDYMVIYQDLLGLG